MHIAHQLLCQDNSALFVNVVDDLVTFFERMPDFARFAQELAIARQTSVLRLHRRSVGTDLARRLHLL
jgi:hypothetical protein